MRSESNQRFVDSALSIRCGFCGARPGRPCMSKSGKEAGWHTPRRHYAAGISRSKASVAFVPDSTGEVTVKPLDSCQICFGHRGGEPGNENIIYPAGVRTVVCDDCHSLVRRIEEYARSPYRDTLKHILLGDLPGVAMEKCGVRLE